MDTSKTTRSCGQCRGCCKPFAVPEVGKIDAGWCKHSSVCGGCAIYDERPYACKAFKCAWLYGKGEEDDRPDRLGVFITVDEFALGSRDATIIHFWEIEEGGLERRRVKEFIKANKEGGHIVCLHQPGRVDGYTERFIFSQDHFSRLEVELFNQSYRQVIMH